MLRLESGSPTATAATWPSALLAAAGRDPYDLVARAVRVAAHLSGGQRQGAAAGRSRGAVPWPVCVICAPDWALSCPAPAPAPSPASAGTARPRVEKEVPPSVDVLGWCTWDA